MKAWAGTPLSGPGDAPAVVPAGYGRARVEISLLERLPDDFLRPLASEAKVVAASGPGDPFPPGPRVNRMARVGLTAADAEAFRARLGEGGFGRWERLGDLTGELGPVSTTAFQVLSRSDQVLPQVRGTIRESLEVRARLAPDGVLSVALVVMDVEDLPPSLPQLEGLSPPAPPDHPRALFGETVALEVPAGEARPVVTILTRSPFDEHDGIAVAAVLEVEPGPAFAEGAAGDGPVRMRGIDEPAAPRRLRGLEVEEPVGERPEPGIEAALPGLAVAGDPRAALLFLARETGARFAADVTPGLPDARIAVLSERVAAGLGGLPRPIELPAAGWVLEREALLLGIEVTENDEDDLLPGILIARAGEMGRYPSDLKVVVGEATDLAAFEEALVRENRLRLRDNSPSSRVRAYDWLLMRGREPAGFDPLGSREERREALDAAEAEDMEP